MTAERSSDVTPKFPEPGGFPDAGSDREAATLHLSIVIVSWNTNRILSRCLDSIFEHLADVPCEVIVVTMPQRMAARR